MIVSPFLDSAEPPVSVQIRAQWGEALLVWELLSSCAFSVEESGPDSGESLCAGRQRVPRGCLMKL